MNKKRFGWNGRQGRLEGLYRKAERGEDLGDVAPELREEFGAEQKLRQELGRLGGGSAPARPEVGRVRFLAAVERQRSESLEEGRKPMIRRHFGARGLGLLAAAGIFAGGAITVGASGGVTGATNNANDVLATLHVPHKTHGHGNTGAAEQPDDADTPEADGTQRAIEGIPADNPSHHPADDDGVCEKGETAVKTTPSGTVVNVPCQAVEGGKGEGHDKTPKADRTPDGDEADADDTADAEETPEANETPGVDGDDNSERHGHNDQTPEPAETEVGE